ncbi:hypothetical protein K6L44_15135 [Gluconacetobacter entanii]|uniref:Uncharacterized protein n=1 Tax=Gluconacetobacter entanii TaxID=108528 RepID=A0ABT3K5A2_9PROT|nr:hypothetical protein [Gluconacetobacter entanii]MBY4641296.1 hypothetical protein [Gluconacetobacter entanii]MCW4580576.1 hypothetical protein [Gluconacetobacter entanii]MCW4583917.1 hypothetical protein [Gluconacetobacter entanii]MCW4587262.1 hypothetical protein [Gluconacetobacter entanii]MCW4590595.1 hypothetical protein [Gluconacetobacter entanii]
MTVVQLLSPLMLALSMGAAAALYLVRARGLAPQAQPVRVRARNRR